MLWNIIKVAFRNISKHRGYACINILGLSIGLASCMLISLWVLDELNHDKFYADSDQIHAVLVNGERITPNALGPYLKESVPEIQFATRIIATSEKLCTTNDLRAYEDAILADPDILDIFSFTYISGNPKTALATTSSIILTESMAARFFPDRDAVGEVITWDNSVEFVVGGVIEDLPHNSSLQCDMIAPIGYVWQTMGPEFEAWNAWSTHCFVKVIPGVSPEQLSQKTATLIDERFEDEEVLLSAINVEDVYFRFSDAKNGVMLFSAVALAILLMAGINFVNLSTARYKMRAREVGLRKVVGANRHGLIAQFLSESFIHVGVSLIIAISIVQTILPMFNSMLGLHLSLDLLLHGSAIFLVIGFVLVTSLAAGIYPSLLLSRFQPIQTMKNDFGQGRRGFSLRRILVVVQFTLSVVLIIGTLVIYDQIDHMKTYDVGYDKEHIVNLPMKGSSADRYDALRNELLRNPNILTVTGSSSPLPYWRMYTTAKWAGMDDDEGQSVAFNQVKHDFEETYKFSLVAGRQFSRAFPSDAEQACIINESLARKMDSYPVLGEKIKIWGQECEVIGVIEDFNFLPLEYGIDPMAFIMLGDSNSVWSRLRNVSMRISPDDINGTVAYIEEAWERVMPDHPFAYSFLDEEFDASYKKFEQMQTLAGGFAALAIFIACLGLVGLAMFTAEQKTKEIGIRKVLGASIGNIVRMLSREFLLLVLIANAIAWPVAWLLMNRWLQEFAYRTDVSLTVFMLVGCAVAIIALLSVGFQAVRAARANPVETLKYE